MKYLKLYENFESGLKLYLSNFESAFNWAKRNIKEVQYAIEDYEEDPKDVNNIRMYELYPERTEEYVKKFNQIQKQKEVVIYRLIMLESLNTFDTDNVGIFWSFEKNCVGHYGDYVDMDPPEDAEEFILTGTINISDIDWPHGFCSFIWYGPEQWECAVKKGSPVTITAINDDILTEPIKGKC
jgi:hypothetical protein